jgi:hypothetical protein
MTLDAFCDALFELEVSHEQLIRDPRGLQWLPEALREAAERDPACRRELESFVETELELHLGAEAPFRDRAHGALFTRRVMEALPERVALDTRRRTWILASFHALAIGVAYLLLAPALQGGSVLDQVHGLMDTGLGFLGGWVVGSAALVVTLAVVLPMAGSHRRSLG